MHDLDPVPHVQGLPCGELTEIQVWQDS